MLRKYSTNSSSQSLNWWTNLMFHDVLSPPTGCWRQEYINTSCQLWWSTTQEITLSVRDHHTKYHARILPYIHLQPLFMRRINRQVIRDHPVSITWCIVGCVWEKKREKKREKELFFSAASLHLFDWMLPIGLFSFSSFLEFLDSCSSFLEFLVLHVQEGRGDSRPSSSPLLFCLGVIVSGFWSLWYFLGYAA